MTPKELKALAKACRQAGITYFKNADIEFTLGAVDAPTPRKASKAAPTSELKPDAPVDSDGPSPEELLFWSSPGTNFDAVENS